MLASLNLTSKNPGYAELSRAIIDAVSSGRLPARSLLPPSRVLAASIGVSRDTVFRCYKHLKSLGWIETRSTGGTYVTGAPEIKYVTKDLTPDTVRLSEYGRRLLNDSAEKFFAPEPVIHGAVPSQSLPTRRWKLAAQRASERLSNYSLMYEEAVLGRPELRSAVSAHLNRSTGIPCAFDEVAIFNVSFNALALICRLFLEPGDVIATEEPGYGGVRDVAAYLGLELLPVTLDAEGLSIEALEQSNKKIKLVYVTPNHQEPSGLTMSFARRKRLLAWAQRNKAFVIEDDYEGFFHYGAKLPPSLKSMDTQDNVIYLGSFWQVLYPITTLCYAVVPVSFMGVLQSAKRNTCSLTENLAQLAVAEMLDDGFLQKHVRKLEANFGEKRRTLIYELKRVFGARVSIPSQTGGLNMMVRFLNAKDQVILQGGLKANLPIASTETFYFQNTHRAEGEMLFCFAALNLENLGKRIESFARSFGERD
jgi:GntR family transcriptional regulator/MocR family aminotransferase